MGTINLTGSAELEIAWRLLVRFTSRMSGRRGPQPNSTSAADRNKEPILNVLRTLLPGSPMTALEVASGQGSHVAYFAANFPQVTWQPSDLNSSSIESVKANSQGLSNVLPFVEIDAANPPASLLQEGEKYELVVCINMIHISPWTATLGLFHMAGKVLRVGGKLVTYGPYAQDGVLAPESNQQFDLNLRSRDPTWGIRDITELKEVGAAQGLNLDQVIEMPANNKSLVFVKKAPGRL